MQKWVRVMKKRIRERVTKAKGEGLSRMIRTSVNIFETSKRDKPQYFVDVVKDKRRTKNNDLEFLIGCRGFPHPKDDTWESLAHLSGSEHMIREFNDQWEKD